MIQDFASVFVGKQSVRVKRVSVRDNIVGKKVIGTVLTGATLAGIAISIVLCLLIRSGLHELAAQAAVKAEMVKTQQALSAKRDALLDQDTLVRSAGKLGLFVAESRQIRHL